MDCVFVVVGEGFYYGVVEVFCCENCEWVVGFESGMFEELGFWGMNYGEFGCCFFGFDSDLGLEEGEFGWEVFGLLVLWRVDKGV